MTTFILKILRDTVLQQKLLPLEALANQEKHPVKIGMEFPIHSYLQVVDHLRFTLERQAIAGCCIWYVNSDDVQLLKDGGVI